MTSNPNSFVDATGATRLRGTLTGAGGAQNIAQVLAAGNDAGGYPAGVVENMYLDSCKFNGTFDGNNQQLTNLYGLGFYPGRLAIITASGLVFTPTQSGDPGNSQFSVYLDDTPGSAALKIVAKDSGGTSVGASIPLLP